MTMLRSRLGHNQPERESFERSAPIRFRALCAGIDPFVAAVAGVKATKPQPHHWWPVGRKGAVCLRCSAFDRGT